MDKQNREKSILKKKRMRMPVLFAFMLLAFGGNLFRDWSDI